MDANKLRIEVFEKTGIKVDTTDPIFALVALNEAVLADYAQQNLSGLHDAVEKLGEQTKQLLDAGERTKALLLQMGHKVDDPAPAPVPAHVPPSVAPPATSKPQAQTMPPLVLAGVTALLAALLVVTGQALFSPARSIPSEPQVAHAPAATPALTPEQQQMMQNGEKFAKAWPKLDAKTQAKIQAAME
jgi:hypothetical protein